MAVVSWLAFTLNTDLLRRIGFGFLKFLQLSFYVNLVDLLLQQCIFALNIVRFELYEFKRQSGHGFNQIGWDAQVRKQFTIFFQMHLCQQAVDKSKTLYLLYKDRPIDIEATSLPI